MATALDMIKRSMRLIGVYAVGDELSADESNDMLSALNTMLDSWSTENLFVYAKSLDTITLSANVGTYTLGPSGGTISPRPIIVSDSSYIDYQTVSSPLTVATLNDYNQIPVKTQITGIPTSLYVLPNMPNVTLQLWPVPSATMTLNLWSNKLLQSFPALTTVVLLPSGYQRAIEFSLAEEIAPEFDVQAPVDVQKKAAQGRKLIKRINTQVPRLDMPYGIPMGNGLIDYRLG